MADNLIKLDAGGADVTPIQPAEPKTAATQDGTEASPKKDKKPKDKDRDSHMGAMEKFLGFATAFLLLSFVVLFGFVYMTMHGLSEEIKNPGQTDLAFVFAGSDLISTSLLRLVAAMAGSAIAFAGLIISFYTHKNQTTLMAGAAKSADGQAAGPNISLSTYSPGIVAIVVGALIIGGSLFSKATHDYTGPITVEHQPEQAPAANGKKPAGADVPPLQPTTAQQPAP